MFRVVQSSAGRFLLATLIMLLIAGVFYAMTQPAKRNDALIKAIQRGDASAVRSLLDQGADPNAVWDRSDFRVRSWRDLHPVSLFKRLSNRRRDSYTDITALGVAAVCGSVQGRTDIIELLLHKGADVDKRFGYSDTALSQSVAWESQSEVQNIAVAKMLLDHGANIDAGAAEGGTALIRAAASGHHATVQFLLSRGAQMDAQDMLGRTALQAAANGRIVSLLTKSSQKR